MRITRILSLTAAFTAALGFTARSQGTPQFVEPVPGQTVVISQMSDNGKWAVTSTAGEEGALETVGALLFEVGETCKKYTITHSSGLCGASDVSDDGNIVVGSANMRPAYLNRATGEWTLLPLPEGYSGGALAAVTPDGKFAVGNYGKGDFMEFWPICYDLTTNTIVDLPGIPMTDMSGADQHQNRLTGISPDGRYLVGQISYSYPADACCYVYDSQNATYKYVGFGDNWTPRAEGLGTIDEVTLSPSGEWAAGMAYMIKERAGSDFPEEYYVTYRYNILTDTFEVYDGEADADTAAYTVDNDGTVYAASPVVNPYSNGFVRYGNYYYSIEQILKQIYGIDFLESTQYAVTGKPCAVSSDAKTLMLIPSTSESYFMLLPEKLSNLCEQIDLLGNYTATPAPGSTFSRITSVKLVFDRNIEVIGDPQLVTLIDANGNTMRQALNVSADGTALNVGFRGYNLEKGMTYRVSIPAGTICIKGDRSVKNRAITLEYSGRGNEPVKLVDAYPADNAEFSRYDINTNPVLLTFDGDVAVAENARGAFYRTGEETQLLTEVLLAASGKQVIAYPGAGQYLYSGSDYRLEIPAGAITDVSGSEATGSEAITLNYRGTYVREVPSDTRYVFIDGCDNYTNWMFYEGDHNQPVQAMVNLDFTADTMPWKVVRDSEESTDMAFGSHSMYEPAGQSNDWVSTPQLFIPDDKTVLIFQSQSYLRGKSDRLKVYVLPADEIYNELTPSVINRFRNEGVLIYDELQDPGASEEGLENDWRDNDVSLEQFAGRNVYIAFLNDNTDQSMVIIDNVKVSRNIPYTYSFTNDARVVQQESVEIKGIISILSDTETYSEISMVLKDAEGDTVSTLSESGLALKNGDNYSFSFPEKLPLTAGEVNSFTVELTLGEENSTLVSSVKNLAFAPVQRVVLEECSGAGCSNCPLGIRAAENLENIYGDRFIPIVLRTFGGDPLGNPVQAYSSYLGFGTMAPLGLINRGEPANPMISGGDGHFYFSGEGFQMSDGTTSDVWYDYVAREFEANADAQVDVEMDYNFSTGAIKANCTVKSAVNLTSQNLMLFGVVTEDNVRTRQSNSVYGNEDPNLGEWGAGGAYGTSMVNPYYMDHIARGTLGVTMGGTGGLVPSTLVAGQEYEATLEGMMPEAVGNRNETWLTVMLIDGNSGHVVNADRVSITGFNSVDEISGSADLKILPAGNTISVVGEGIIAVEIYNLSGSCLGAYAGVDALAIDASDMNGVVIVKASNGHTVKTAKLIL